MPAHKKRSAQDDTPEFIVKRNTFDRYFDSPMPRSTFYDRVNEGLIIPWPHMNGHFYLNASLRRLGLPTTTKLPEKIANRSLEDITRLAFTLIDPVIFPSPPWLLHVEFIDVTTANHATLMADKYREKIQQYNTLKEKLQYFAGVLDAASFPQTNHS